MKDFEPSQSMFPSGLQCIMHRHTDTSSKMNSRGMDPKGVLVHCERRTGSCLFFACVEECERFLYLQNACFFTPVAAHQAECR